MLDNGTLSYYRNQEEENKACRGSVHLKFAQVKATSSTGFDVQSAGADSRFPRYSLRASHPQEAANWAQSIKLHIEFAHTGGLLDSSASSMLSAKRTSNTFRRPLTRTSSAAEIPLAVGGLEPIVPKTSPRSPAAPFARLPSPSMSLDDEGTVDDDASILNGTSKSIHHVHLAGLPHEDKYEMLANSTREHLDLCNQLLDALVVGPSRAGSINETGGPATSSAPLARSVSSTSSRQQTVKDSIRQSLKVLSDLIVEYQGMSTDRTRWLIAKYQAEIQAKTLWEESMQDAAQAAADMERDLHEASVTNSRQRKELRAVRMMSPGGNNVLEDGGEYPLRRGSLLRGRGDDVFGAGAGTSPVRSPSTSQVTTPNAPNKSLPSVPPVTSTDFVDPSHPSVTIVLPSPPPFHPSSRRSSHVQGQSVSTPQDEDDEDDEEFFDAIEEGSLPLQIPKSFAAASGQKPVAGTEVVEDEVDQREAALASRLESDDYKPYKNLRDKLPISDDQRPAISLWSILKSSIGKDLTKISFPVAFNECTSMLQRMAEDMEYSECREFD